VSAQNPRFPLFDSLRAIAALSILVFHVSFVPGGLGDSGTASRYIGQLQTGVAIFFLVSGFLLYRPFVAARFAGRPMPPLVPYAIRRFFRIVPVYWFAMPLIAVWLEKPKILHDLVPYLGFAQIYDRSTLFAGYGPAWTLCVEVTFYLLLPFWAFALRRLPGRTRRQLVTTEVVVLALVVVGSFAWKVIHTPHQLGFVPITPASSSLPAFMDYLGLGMFLAIASVALAGRARPPAVVRVVHRAPWIPWLVAGGAFVAACQLGSLREGGHELLRHELRALVAFGLLLPAVFGDDCGGAVRRLLADRRLQWVGLVSYSLYIWHAAVAQRLARGGWEGRLGPVGFALLAMAASFAVAALSFYVVERPGIRIGRRLAGRHGYQEIQSPPAGSLDKPGAPAIELAGSDRPSS
jgi:peptidoglycan/LPS O-acetylase OafA/YrhL